MTTVPPIVFQQLRHTYMNEAAVIIMSAHVHIWGDRGAAHTRMLMISAPPGWHMLERRNRLQLR